MNLGEKAEQLAKLRGEKDEVQARLSEINKSIDSLEYEIIKEMEQLGLDKIKSPYGTVSVKVELYPQVKDMDAFVAWAATHGRSDLIQKRVSAGSFKEYFANTGEYPDGIDTFNKSTLSFRRGK